MKVKHINDTNAPSYCNIPKKPLIKKRNPTTTPLLFYEACSSLASNQKNKLCVQQAATVLRNKVASWRMEDSNLGTELWETKFGRLTGLGFKLFVVICEKIV